ncbi:MAG: DUF92 domain-containing protein [Vulcanimicrobiaceae bacterium]
MTWLIGAILAGAIALLALRARALTRDGALAAFVVGTITYGVGTWVFTAVLLAFFVPSVLLSRLGRARKRALVDVGKQGPRDAAQVLANGGVATLCALAFGFTHASPWLFAFVGAYATATADTWATEIGTLVRGQPRSILTLRPLAPGLSGGVTWAGSAAAFVGAWWLGTVGAVLVIREPLGWLVLGLACAVVGFLGATVDSVLGATLQELRRCPSCERLCETDPHACGTPSIRVRGLSWMTNDLVNAVATAAGAALAFAFV